MADIFAEIPAPLVVCIGGDVEKGLYEVLGKPVSTAASLVGWGDQTARLSRYDRRVLPRLPHLSRFGVFGRTPSEEPLRRIRHVTAAELGIRD